jgi:hypothetical protein
LVAKVVERCKGLLKRHKKGKLILLVSQILLSLHSQSKKGLQNQFFFFLLSAASGLKIHTLVTCKTTDNNSMLFEGWLKIFESLETTATLLFMSKNSR